MKVPSQTPVAECVENPLSKDIEEKPSPTVHEELAGPSTQNWRQSIVKNPKAFGWCCYMLFICIMWGYDGLASGIVLAIPQFRQDYGYLYNGQYVVPAKWQLAFTGGSLVGSTLGAIIAGRASRYMEQKTVVILAYVVTVAGVCCQWFSPGNLPLFFGSKLITGVPLGAFMTVAPVYCSEVAPQAIRGAFLAAVNSSIVLGQLIGYGVMRETQKIPGVNSYRIMFAVQWGFAVAGIFPAAFLPESPVRLLALGRSEKAVKSIHRLYHPADWDTLVQHFQNSVLPDDDVGDKGPESFLTCFKRPNLQRTLVALSVFFFQNSTGVFWVVGYMGYFLQLSGLQGDQVFDLTVAIAGVMACGSLVSSFLIERFGRRSTVLSGYGTCTVALLLIGILSLFNGKGRQVILAQVGFMAAWAFMYQAAIGPIGYALVAEIPTSSLRGVTQAMANVVNGLVGACWSFALPYMINPDEANMGGKVAFVFFGILVLGCLWVFYMYPETKGRSFEEIDELYRRKTSPRHWKKAELSFDTRVSA